MASEVPRRRLFCTFHVTMPCPYSPENRIGAQVCSVCGVAPPSLVPSIDLVALVNGGGLPVAGRMHGFPEAMAVSPSGAHASWVHGHPPQPMSFLEDQAPVCSLWVSEWVAPV